MSMAMRDGTDGYGRRMAPKSPFLVAARTLLRPQDDPQYGAPGRPAWLDVDWPAHTHRLEIQGSGVEYVDLGSGPGAPIVFIHGLGACWQTWLENLPYFAREHRCIAMDLPGVGRSEPMHGDVTIEHYAEVVDHLLRRIGIEEPVVVGNSMGGFIATQLAIRFPTDVSKMVLVSAAVFWQEYWRAKPLVRFAAASDAVVSQLLMDSTPRIVRRPKLRAMSLAFGGSHLPHLLSPELQHELVLTARRTEGFLPALQALANFPLREDPSEVACPTL